MRAARRCLALYFAAFFLAAAAAPHHHLNPVADIVSDGPSNSGKFAQFQGHADSTPGFVAGSLVDDEWCLACFNRDFVASPAVTIALTPTFVALPHDPAPSTLALPDLRPADTSSRAPPVLA
jgi:hypothetical protein